MAKSFGTFEHTADIGLRARADSLAELLEALAEALAEFICPAGRVAQRAVRTMSAASQDVEGLAVDFLGQVLNVIQTERFMVGRVAVTAADDRSLTAELHGEPYDPARHEIHTEVKAVTYHMLEVRRHAEGWRGQVLLDL